MNTNIKDRLFSIVKALLQDKSIFNDITLSTTLEADLGFDSIHQLTLLHKIEQYFSIELPEERWGDRPFTTLGQIFHFLLAHTCLEEKK